MFLWVAEGRRSTLTTLCCREGTNCSKVLHTARNIHFSAYWRNPMGSLLMRWATSGELSPQIVKEAAGRLKGKSYTVVHSVLFRLNQSFHSGWVMRSISIHLLFSLWKTDKSWITFTRNDSEFIHWDMSNLSFVPHTVWGRKASETTFSPQITNISSQNNWGHRPSLQSE